MKKIGMCCLCGDQLPKRLTRIIRTGISRGLEVCKSCAEERGLDWPEEEEE